MVRIFRIGLIKGENPAIENYFALAPWSNLRIYFMPQYLKGLINEEIRLM